MAETERALQEDQADELVSALGVVTSRLRFDEMGKVLDLVLGRLPEEERGLVRREMSKRYDVGDEALPYRRMVDYLNPPPGGS